MKRILSMVLTIAMVMGMTTPFGVVYGASLTPVEEKLAGAIRAAYEKAAPGLYVEIEALAKPRVEQIGIRAIGVIEGYKGEFDAITFQQVSMDSILAQIPPESSFSMIPEAYRSQALESSKPNIEASIHETFMKTEAEIDVLIDGLLRKINPVVVEALKPEIKTLIYDVGDLIDARLNATIEQEIMAVVPSLMDQLPPEIAKLEPKEIAAHYAEKMIPIAEEALSTQMAPKVKEIIMQQVEVLVEDKINTYMLPKLDVINEEVYKKVLAALPQYVVNFIGADYIKGLVNKEMEGLKARMPEKMEKNETMMKAAIKTEIDKFVADTTKIYVDGKLSVVKSRILNGKTFADVNQLTKALGGAVKVDAKTKVIKVTKGKSVVTFKVGSKDVVAVGKTSYVPVETVTKALGYEFNQNTTFGMTTIE